MARIALVDYGAGNLTSVRKGFAAAGAELFTPASPAELAAASAIVVPGVGHFRATAALEGRWRDAILAAISEGIPLLGICLGLQWLFEGSTEAPEIRGLGAIAGRSVRLPSAMKVPHVGWNSLHFTRPSPLFAGIPDGAQMYFTHSYAAPVTPECLASTTYGTTFAAAVGRDRIFGVQFHPEKSGDAGITVLRNFVTLVGSTRPSIAGRSTSEAADRMLHGHAERRI
jgi:glutamine amidotransferase